MPATPPARPAGYPSPHVTIAGIACSIALEDMGEGAVVESWPADGPQATVMFKCAYADRYTVIKGLRGYSTVSGLSWTYSPPVRYYPSPNLICTGIGEVRGLRPWTDGVGWLQYDWAIIPATFTVPTWGAIDQPPTDASGLQMTTTKFRGSPEVVAPPVGSFFYTEGPSVGKKVQDSSVGVVLGKVQVSMTRHQVPFPYLDGPLWLVGRVNDTEVTFGDRTFTRGTLLFADFDNDYQPDAQGNPAWDYTFNLIGSDSKEWNAFFDPGGELALVNTAADASGDYPFAYAPFDLLFSDDFQRPPGA